MSTLAQFLAAISLIATIGCSADTATQEYAAPREAQLHRAQPLPELAPVVAVVPENPGDRSIRRELTQAIDLDPDLHGGNISFIVTNGDVSVTGIVESEKGRDKITELAMGISGVKSVANALRVSP